MRKNHKNPLLCTECGVSHCAHCSAAAAAQPAARLLAYSLAVASWPSKTAGLEQILPPPKLESLSSVAFDKKVGNLLLCFAKNKFEHVFSKSSFAKNKKVDLRAFFVPQPLASLLASTSRFGPCLGCPKFPESNATTYKRFRPTVNVSACTRMEKNESFPWLGLWPGRKLTSKLF